MGVKYYGIFTLIEGEMGELNYQQSDHDWAWEKGIKRKCQKHNIEYDLKIGCKKCLEEESEKKKQKLKEAFDNIVWPDK